MAFVQPRNQALDDAEEQKRQQAAFASGSTAGDASVTSPQATLAGSPTSVVSQPKKGSGSFFNIKQMLDANKPQAEKLGTKIADSVVKDKAAVETKLNDSANKFKADVEAGNNATGVYNGPQNAETSKYAQPIIEDTTKVVERGELTDTSSGRGQLVDEQRKNKFNLGGRMFDKALVDTNTGGALNKVQAAGASAKALENVVQKKAEELNQYVADEKANNRFSDKSVRDYIDSKGYLKNGQADFEGIYNDAVKNNVSAEQLDRAYGLAPGTAAKWIADQGFAALTNRPTTNTQAGSYDNATVRDYVGNKGYIKDGKVDGYAIYNDAVKYGVTADKLDRAYGLPPGTVEKWIADKGLTPLGGQKTPVTNGPDSKFTVQQVRDYISQNKVTDPNQVFALAQKYGVSAATINEAMGFAPGTAEKWIAERGYAPLRAGDPNYELAVDDQRMLTGTDPRIVSDDTRLLHGQPVANAAAVQDAEARRAALNRFWNKNAPTAEF